jgi:hypothetical protein
VPDAALSGHLGALRLAERLHEAYHVAVCRPCVSHKQQYLMFIARKAELVVSAN